MLKAQVTPRKINLAERIYQQLKQDIFTFKLLPGEHFSEADIAQRMQASRTPVREALYRLERDGLVQVYFRSGWQVKQFDFRYFEDLYDVLILLEKTAIEFLCKDSQSQEKLAGLMTIWQCKPEQRITDSQEAAYLDEEFHFELMALSNNQEMIRIHRDVCERLRIIRALDFTQPERINTTYDEHAHLLTLICDGDAAACLKFLEKHIRASKNTVRDITLHRMQTAQSRSGA